MKASAEYPAPETLKWLEHAYSLKEALDRTWAARPIAIVRNRDRVALVLEDPGGIPLDQLLGATRAGVVVALGHRPLDRDQSITSARDYP